MSLKTASVLAFERKLNPSDALLYAGNWADRDDHTKWSGVEIQEKAIRGTISNRLKNAIASDPAKLDAEVQKPNLQTVDAAALPPGANTLAVRFSLRALGGIGLPSACNDQSYQAALQATVRSYLDEHGLSTLAHRYACNIASGRFLWRNRIGAESIEVRTTLGEDGDTLRFDAGSRSLHDFGTDDQVAPLANFIEAGLSGDQHCLINVTALARLGPGQEVYPSQELVQDKTKSKYLYSVSGIAGIHSQKIGNALRTIDTWHASVDDIGAIAVEPYGSVTSRGTAYRTPKQKSDFYTLLDNWVLKGKAPDVEQQHYVVAVLIRGGVFGEVNS